MDKLIKPGTLLSGLLNSDHEPTPLFHVGLMLLIALQLTLVGYCKVTLYQKSLVTSDGALYANALRNTNFIDKFLFTHYLYVKFGYQSYLQDHFAPTLLLIAPVYRLLPSPLTLLIAQTITPGIACGLIYWCGLKVLKNQPLSFFIAAAYLFLPSTISGTIDDIYGFHPDSLVPPLILLMYLFMIKRRTLLYVVALALALGLKENLPVMGTFLGAELILYGLLRRQRFFVDVGAATLALAVIFAFVGLWLFPHLTGHPPQYAQQVITSLIQGDFKDPAILLYWISVVIVFLPALLAPEVLVLIIPDLISFALVGYPPYDWHIFTPITIIAVACIVGVSRLLHPVVDQSPPLTEKEYLAFIPVPLQEKAARVLGRFHPSWAFFALIVLFLAVAIRLHYPTPPNVFSFGQEVNEVFRSLIYFLSYVGVVLIVLMTANWLLKWAREAKVLLAASLLPLAVAIGFGGVMLQREVTIIQSQVETVNMSDLKYVASSIPPESYLAVTSDLLIYFTDRPYLLWPGDQQAEYMLVNGTPRYDYDRQYGEDLQTMLAAHQVEVLSSRGSVTLYHRTR